MSGSLPSEGVYEDIGVVPVGEKEEGPRVSQNLALEEEYDDAGEPEQGPEEERAEDEEEAPLNPAGAHLCALLPTLLLLLHSYAQASALASAYI